MYIFMVILIYILVNVYIFRKILSWITAINNRFNQKLLKIIITILFCLCFSTSLLGYILPLSQFQKRVQEFANYYMGILFYLVMLAILFDLIKIIIVKLMRLDKKILKAKKYLYISGIFSVLLVIFISIYGYYHAKDIKIKKYNINIEKKIESSKKLRIALVSDFHLGYSVGYKMIEKMVSKINNEKVDIILIAGDIFDNSYKTVDNMDKVSKSLNKLKSKYGTYAVYGNHDVEEKLIGGFSVKRKYYRNPKMDKIILDSGIKVLNDENVFLDYFYVIGRKDAEKVGDGTNIRKNLKQLLKNIDQSKPIIILEHEPEKLEEISDQNVDLHLAAHTHAGQFFPLTLGMKFIWKNSYGLRQKNKASSIVTSGIGVYGPNMRIGTNSEICILNISFN